MTDKKSKILDIRQCGETISAAGNFSGKTKSDIFEITGKAPEKSVNSEKKYKEETKENCVQSKAGDFLDILIEYLLRLLVFVLPLFVLPFSVEVYEFNKTLLLFVVSSLAFLIWIAKMVLIDRRLTLVRTPLDIPIIIFVLIATFSTIFSVDKVSSILGFYGRFSDSLMVYLSLAMFYFTAVNSIRNWKLEIGNYRAIDNFIKTFLASAFVIAIVSLFYILGFKFIPWPEAQFRSFNLAGGSLNILAIYLIPVIIISLSYINKNSKIAARYTLSLLVILSLFVLAVADFILAWIILAVSLAMVLVMALISKRALITSERILESGLIAVVLISLIFIASSLTFINKDVQTNFSSSAISDFLRDRLAGGEGSAAKEGFAKEVIIEKGVAISVAADSSKSRPILGSGPGTYLYDFSKFKPAEFNNNNFWYVRFDKAGSEILEKFSTIGIAGALSYLMIIILAMGMFLKMLLRRRHIDVSPSGVYIFAAWFALLLFQFLYLESTATKFVFWLFTAILAAEYVTAKKFHSPKGTMEPADYFILDLKKNKTALPVSLAALLIIFASLAASYYYQLKFYQSEMIYKKEVAKQNEDKDINNLNEVIGLNPYRGDYEAYLSNVYLFRGSKDFKSKDKMAENQNDVDKITLEIKSAVDHAKKAVELEPNNVILQQNLGSVYAILARDFTVSGADEWAIKAYGRATELEPTNSVLRVEAGKIRLLKYFQSKSENDISEAINEFEKALELKSDYLPARLQLGLAYEAAGDNQKAISQLSNYIGSGDAEIIFQLGKIYFNTEETDKAKNLFLEVLKINPRNSNAHYGLGLVYKKEGDLPKALEEFNLVLSMNPGNADVTGKIDEINAMIKKAENTGEAENSGKNNVKE